MENKATLTAKVVSCDECKHEWLYEETNLEKTHWQDDEGEVFVVLSFVCPNCGKQYIVCVDNEVTFSEKDELAKIAKSLAGARNATVYGMLWSRYKRLLARVTKHQDVLKKAYLVRAERGVLREVK